MNKKTVLFMLTLLIISCTQDDENEQVNDSFIFGQFYGECLGEACIETFKIENNQLYEDKSDQYGQDSFEFELRSQEDFDLVSNLPDQLPQELLLEVSQTFGCPDCADQGGIYLEIGNNQSEENKLKFRLDMDKTDVPDYLHDYMDEIINAIGLLQ